MDYSCGWSANAWGPICLISAALALAIPVSISTCSPCRPSGNFFSIVIRESRCFGTTYNVCKHGSTQKDHMSSPRWIFYPDFEFLSSYRLAGLPRARTGDRLTFSLSGFPPSTFVNHSCFSSFSSRDGKPGYMLLPPLSTIALYRLLLTSTSVPCIVLNRNSEMPGCSTSTRCGWNRHSGASNRSLPTLITRPSGSV